ncbi:hypothetical protein EDD86DRAFT_212869 [Gorgonomyces haynaldii]|nr:hypothetical protein EDD86DRAFT_212869 [Gorgonomyces haynaldii]
MTQSTDVLSARPLPGGQFYLVLTDGSATAQKAIEFVVQMSKPKDMIEIFQALPVVQNTLGPSADPDDRQEIMVNNYKLLEQILKKHNKTVHAFRSDATHGDDTRTTITKRIQIVDPDLVAFGSRGLGTVEGLFLGSCSNYLVQTCPKPVLMIK